MRIISSNSPTKGRFRSCEAVRAARARLTPGFTRHCGELRELKKARVPHVLAPLPESAAGAVHPVTLETWQESFTTMAGGARSSCRRIGGSRSVAL